MLAELVGFVLVAVSLAELSGIDRKGVGWPWHQTMTRGLRCRLCCRPSIRGDCTGVQAIPPDRYPRTPETTPA